MKALLSAFLSMYLTAIFCQTQLYEGPLKNGQTKACLAAGATVIWSSA